MKNIITLFTLFNIFIDFKMHNFIKFTYSQLPLCEKAELKPKQTNVLSKSDCVCDNKALYYSR